MIQVIHRAFDILEFVARDAERPKLLSEIATGLQLKPGTCANIVKTLTGRGYLEKLEAQKGYLLGKQAFALPGSQGQQQALIDIADREMEKIRTAIHENSLLGILKGENRLVIHRKNSDQLVQAHTPDEKKAYDSSTGRLLIAMQTDEQLKKFIQRFGLPPAALWPHAHTKNRFFEQVEKIRSNGYALIEDSVQIVGLAAPVYKDGRVIASLSIYMPSFRFNSSIKAKMLKLAVTAARKISAEL
ncbi:MAG: IclR family transcriptional regulator [Chitinophagaceae bacterium]|nr:IclR family transcriptional regulator [Chitinophagaceae bacterium]